MSNKELEQSIVKQVALKVAKEIRKLCKSQNILKQVKPSNLKTFSMAKILKEWRSYCPTFHTILHGAAVPPSYSEKRKEECRVPMLMAGSILFRCWNKRMSALQHVIGIILHESQAKKKVKCNTFLCTNRGVIRTEFYKSKEKKNPSYKAINLSKPFSLAYQLN